VSDARAAAEQLRKQKGAHLEAAASPSAAARSGAAARRSSCSGGARAAARRAGRGGATRLRTRGQARRCGANHAAPRGANGRSACMAPAPCITRTLLT